MRDSRILIKERKMIKKAFHSMFEAHESVGRFNKNGKIYLDFCHISPIKMHFSFSLSGADALKNQNIFVNNPFFKSIGLVLTDVQDVIFKYR